jgi:large conductance mechanosensitive channel
MGADFIAFLRKTNALALAIAVIIGTAIGKVVTSVVGDLLMPVIGLWLGGGDVDFVIIAFFVFVITKALIREEAPAPGPVTKTCPACAETILAKATRCKFCTSPV